MDTKQISTQIMTPPDLSARSLYPDDFFKSRLINDLLNFLIKEEVVEFDFSDSLVKKATMTVVYPRKR